MERLIQHLCKRSAWSESQETGEAVVAVTYPNPKISNEKQNFTNGRGNERKRQIWNIGVIKSNMSRGWILDIGSKHI